MGYLCWSAWLLWIAIHDNAAADTIPPGVLKNPWPVWNPLLRRDLMSIWVHVVVRKV